MTAPVPPTGTTSRGPLAGIAVGLALVLLAALVGVVGERAAAGPAGAGASVETSAVEPTGETTTVQVVTKDMRFHPAEIEVPVGNKLVIEVVNEDDMRHDLVLANGAHTPKVAPGKTVRLDAGVIGADVEGWCSLPGHKQAGMVLDIIAVGAAAPNPTDTASAEHDHSSHGTTSSDSRIDMMAEPDDDFKAHDAALPPAPAAKVHRLTFTAQEHPAEVAVGVTQEVWTFNGTVPGPTLRGKVGDVFEITFVNAGKMEHGIDFHASALAPDKPMRSIAPGERLTYKFTAHKAGIWMYHCSTMPMLHHIGNGMYGAVIIDPPDLPQVEREYVLVQSEFYLGAEGQPGDLAKMQAEQPDAVVFNGYAFQYLHRPLPAKVGERVRIWLLNAGPNRSGAFHVVGGQFDTVYLEGSYRLRPSDPGGSQVLDLAPASGGFVELVFPEAGHYRLMNHAMVDAERGAEGMFEVTN